MQNCTQCPALCDNHYWIGNDVVCHECFIAHAVAIGVEPEERITETPQGVAIFYPADRFQPAYNIDTHAPEWPVLTHL